MCEIQGAFDTSPLWVIAEDVRSCFLFVLWSWVFDSLSLFLKNPNPLNTSTSFVGWHFVLQSYKAQRVIVMIYIDGTFVCISFFLLLCMCVYERHEMCDNYSVVQFNLRNLVIMNSLFSFFFIKKASCVLSIECTRQCACHFRRKNEDWSREGNTVTPPVSRGALVGCMS